MKENKLIKNNEELIKKVIDEYVDLAYEEKQAEEAGKLLLLPPEQYKEKLRAEFMKAAKLDDYRKKMEIAYQKIIDVLPEMVSEEQWILIKQDLGQVAKDFDFEEFFEQETSKEYETLQQVFELSDETILWFYRVGKKLYDEHDYSSATAIFTYLSILDPYVYDFWIALGLSKQNEEDFTGAVEAFLSASIMSNDEPASHFYAAECYLAMKDKEKARLEYSKALHLADKNITTHEWEPLISGLNEAMT